MLGFIDGVLVIQYVFENMHYALIVSNNRTHILITSLTTFSAGQAKKERWQFYKLSKLQEA